MVREFGFNPYELNYRKYKPAEITPWQPDDQVQTEGTDLYTQELLNRLQTQQQAPATRTQTPMEQGSWNPLINAWHDVQLVGTGLQQMWNHPKETIVDPLRKEYNKITNIVAPPLDQQDYNPLNQIGRNLKATKELGKDTFNFLASNYDITTGDITDVLNGRQSAKDVAMRAAMNAYQHPLLTTLDVIGAKGAVKGLKGGVKATGKAAEKEIISNARKVEDALNTATAEVKSKTYNVLEKFHDLRKSPESSVMKSIEALETGEVLTGETNKAAVKTLSKLVDYWDNAVPEFAKVNKQDLALNQKLVREGTANTIAEADKLLQSYKSGGQLSKEALEILSKDGDKVAGSLLKGMNDFEKGYLKLVPHGLAEVVRTAEGTIEVGEMADRLFAGRYSTRAWGNASYSDIAKQLLNPYEWVDAQTRAWIEEGITREIMEKGTLGGRPLVEEGAKKVKYIEPVDGESKVSLKHALDTASDTPLSEKSIAIDADLVKELNNQVKNMVSNPFKSGSFLSDTYTVTKQNWLNTLGYLAGNATTGLYNALMNAGLSPVGFAQDIIDAVRTKGKLAKQVGTWRELRMPEARVKNPVLKTVATANKPISYLANLVDARLQNIFSEMSLNRNLRQAGVSLANREQEIANMGKMQLAELVRDNKMMALINPTRTILPQQAHGFASLVNPYWRWMDTALQSSKYMFDKKPLLSNAILNHFASTIAFNEGMQQNLNLGVQNSKPFVSYRYNPHSKQVEEVSAEFAPIMNTLRLANSFGEAVAEKNPKKLMNTLGSAQIPLFSVVVNSVNGVDKYGKPLVRPEMDRPTTNNLKAIVGTERREYRAGEGWVVKEGGYADEILTQSINELFSLPRFVNRTAAPAAAGLYNQLTNSNIRYYQPYANQLFGQFSEAGVMPSSANPRRSAAGEEFVDLLKGQYARRYNPMEDIVKPNVNLQKQMLKNINRRSGMSQMILNQYGGE